MADIFMAFRSTDTTKMFERGRRSAADWLCLAAAPTFAIMALVTALGGGQPDMFCATTQDASPLSGMVPMYLLMSAFHSVPWLKLMQNH